MVYETYLFHCCINCFIDAVDVSPLTIETQRCVVFLASFVTQQ